MDVNDRAKDAMGDIELTAGGRRFGFHWSPEGTRLVAPIALAEWDAFRSRNSVPGREGQQVLLQCPRVYGQRDDGELADRAGYERSLDYFLTHRAEIQGSALAACVAFVRELHAASVHYDVERHELAPVAAPDDLRAMIDLSYVQLFPYQQRGLPYIGLAFETDWADEGLLALLLGTEVLARGYPGTEAAVDLSIRDDGGTA